MDKTLVPIEERNESQCSKKHEDKDHESAVSVDTQLEENYTNDSFVVPVDCPDDRDNLNNIEDAKDNFSIDQISIMTSDKQDMEHMTPNQSLETELDEKEIIASENVEAIENIAYDYTA